MISFIGKYTTANVMIDDIDAETQGQIIQFINHLAFTEPVVVMSDCHAGKAAVIGFTMPLPTTGFIVPNVVGVDVGCGMFFIQWVNQEEAIRILQEKKEEVDRLIRDVIPTSTDVHTNSAHIYDMVNLFPWKVVSETNRKFCQAYNKRTGFKMQPTVYTYEWFQKKCEQVGMDFPRAVASIGTLGGGK
jgi:tRNA-splicing ligase RtcB (3'-phosphate/5'-hydroxy nucleic acid ligase)